MKKLYIPVIGATMAICLLFAACGTRNDEPNTTTSTTTTTTTSTTSASTTTTSGGQNMLEEGFSDVSSGLSEAGSEIKSDISKMR